MNRSAPRLFVLLALAASLQRTCAQPMYADQFNAWTSLLVNAQVNDRYWLVQETFLRRSNGFLDPMQFKTGLSLERRGRPWAFSVGYAYWLTYPYGEFRTLRTQPEHRFWQQVNVKHRFLATDRSTMEHRFRVEERMIERFRASDGLVRSDGFKFQGRFRWQVQAPYRLGKRTEGYGVKRLIPFAEGILRFGDDAFKGLLDQWRAGLLLGWRTEAAIELRIGYQFQYLIRADDISTERNHTLLLGMVIDLPKKPRPPKNAG